MKFPSPVSLKWLSTFLGAELIGDANAFANGINEIHKVEEGDLVFVDHPKYYDKCLQSDASFIMINNVVACPPGKTLLIVPKPFDAYLAIVHHFRPFIQAREMVSASAVIGKGSYIAPGSFIGHQVSIGEDCKIAPGAVILDHCVIGNNVVIQ